MISSNLAMSWMDDYYGLNMNYVFT